MASTVDTMPSLIIQIQHLLKLNQEVCFIRLSSKGIQIQHLLKLNPSRNVIQAPRLSIQIQHLLKLNLALCRVIATFILNSNTTLVKVKYKKSY